MRTINEPTAAAIAYDLDKEAVVSAMYWATTWVSTFDASLLTIRDDIFDACPLQATRIWEARS